VNENTAQQYNIAYKLIDAPTVEKLPAEYLGNWCLIEGEGHYNQIAANVCPAKQKKLTVNPNDVNGDDFECLFSEIHQLAGQIGGYKRAAEVRC
jgi:hypothetical protein